jgi:hypothetical protein
MFTELVDVNAYNWDTLPACGFFEVLGKRGTGKTTWTQYILQSSPTRNTGNFIVMAGSETAKSSWSKIVHPIFVVDPDLKYLENLRDTQNTIVRKYQKSGEPFPSDRKITLVLDDVSSNKKLMRSQILSYLASNSRHLEMSIFVLAQYHCQIVTEVRNQFDQVFMLSTSDTKSIVRLHAEYCSGVDFRIFKHVLGHVTQDHGMLIIDNQATSSQIDSICFYATMDTYPPPLVRLGPEDVWDFGEDYYCDEHATRPDAAMADAWQQNQEEHLVVTDRKGKLIIRKN